MAAAAGFILGAVGFGAPALGSAMFGGWAVGAAFASTALGGIAVKLMTSVAVSALSNALRSQQRQMQAGITTSTTLTGEEHPESIILGWTATAGSAVCPPMSHGRDNRFLTHVIEICSAPGAALSRLIVNGDYVELGTQPHPEFGLPVLGQYNGLIWIRFYDGNQTAADPMLLAKYGNHPDRPWDHKMVGHGICYAILTFCYHRERLTQVPRYLIEVDGIPLYDPRQDSSVGGLGPQRWNNPDGWTRTRNNAVIAYNIMRGIRLPGGDVWGGSIDPQDLPLDNWFAAMNACDLPVARGDGTAEPQFRCGVEVALSEVPAEALEKVLRGCSGRIADIAGIWKIRVGAPGLPIMQMTDGDIVVSREQTHDPFPDLDSTHNGIEAQYPDPDALWQVRDAPARYNANWEAADRFGRKVASVQLPATPYPLQVQRLMRAWIEDERRFRVHGHVLPPSAQSIEPLDCLTWSSLRHGYEDKLFEVAEVVDDLMTCCVGHSIREVDNSDYDWAPEFELPSIPPSTGITPPDPEIVAGWNLLPEVLRDNNGADRRPALRLVWNSDIIADGIEWEIRVAGASDLRSGSTMAVASGGLVLADGILPQTPYEGRSRLILTGRTAVWSEWVGAVSPDLRLAEQDILPEIIDRIEAAVEAARLASEEAEAVRDQMQTLVDGLQEDMAGLIVDYDAARAAADMALAARDLAQTASEAASDDLDALRVLAAAASVRNEASNFVALTYRDAAREARDGSLAFKEASEAAAEAAALARLQALDILSDAEAARDGSETYQQAASAAAAAAQAARIEAQEAASSADGSAVAAAGSAQAAGARADEAGSSAEAATAAVTAAEAARDEADIRAVAAAESATAAAASASDAEVSAAVTQSERLAAETARSSAEAASTSAALARDDAEGAAAVATEKAGVAAVAANDATGQAQAALNSAVAAQAHVDDAAAAAAAAQGERLSAETARAAAESASTSAASAREDAAAAASQASSSASDAATAATAAGDKADAAADSAALASARADDAGVAATAAQQDRVLAQAALSGAEDAATASSTSAVAAAAHASAAAQDAALVAVDRQAAETARTGAEAAREIAVTARETAESAMAAATDQALLATEAAGQAATSAQVSQDAAALSVETAEGALSQAALIAGVATEAVSAVQQTSTQVSDTAETVDVLAAAQEVRNQAQQLLNGVFTSEAAAHRSAAATSEANADEARAGAELAQIAAAQSANSAGNAAAAAAQSAQTAGTYSSEAGASAEAAQISAAQAATERAQAGLRAEDAAEARQDAEDAAASASSSAALAAEARTDAELAANAALASSQTAAASANEAAQEALASTAQRLVAETARAGAQTAETGAVAARQDAEGSAAAASTAATLAADAATAAGHGASAAASSATVADVRATEAEQAATIASQQRQEATTAAGQASLSASAAAVSATAADGSAQIAAGYEQSVRSSLMRAAQPSEWSQGAIYWTAGASGRPETVGAPNAAWSYVDGHAYVTTTGANSQAIRTRGVVDAVEGDPVRVNIRARLVSGTAAQPDFFRIYWSWLDENYGLITTTTTDLEAGDRTALRNAPAGSCYCRVGLAVIGARISNPATARIERLGVQSSAVEALILNQVYTRAQTDSAIASATTGLSAQLGDVTAAVTQQATAIATLEDNASAMIAFRAQAGSQAAALELVAANDPTGPVSVARISAENILLDGSVAMQHLVVTDLSGNLIPNGDLSWGDLRGWTPISNAQGIEVRDTSIFGAGIYTNAPTRYVLYVPQAAAAQEMSPGVFAVKGGDRIAVSYWHAVQSGGAASFSLTCVWLDRSGAIISTSSTTVNSSSNTWARYEGVFTAPAAAVRCSLRFARIAGTGFLLVAAFEARRQQEGTTLIRPGSITTGEINTTSFQAAGLSVFGGAIQSNNWLPGVSGWRITEAGSAEINDLSVRQDMIVSGAVSRRAYADVLANLVVPAESSVSNPRWVFWDDNGDIDILFEAAPYEVGGSSGYRNLSIISFSGEFSSNQSGAVLYLAIWGKRTLADPTWTKLDAADVYGWSRRFIAGPSGTNNLSFRALDRLRHADPANLPYGGYRYFRLGAYTGGNYSASMLNPTIVIEQLNR
ncbi:hypothetical protein [Halodurantibacterium flavum]|uniref:DUF1983 domain-containing protein n=1 Tax=Halodurantibacterium flavum TaxID=1382802 RepID=A0ABW4SBV4_9RHOB